MEYARIEIALVRRGWARPVPVPGAVPGPAFAVNVDPTTLHVAVTTLAARRLRKLGAAPPAALEGNVARGVAVKAGATLVGARGTLGRVARLWVDRETMRVM